MDNEQEFAFSFNMVFDFIKIYKWRIILFALLSLAVIAMISFLICFILPGRQYMTQKIEILLPKQDMNIVYPNKKKFNRLDIVSPPVLKEVYNKNNLAGIIDFEDFQNALTVVNFSMERALLDADIASKLSKRNLNAADISNIEREYRNAVSRIDSSTYNIIFDKSKVPPLLAAKVLNDIAQTWFNIYSNLESDKLPTTNIDSKLEKIISQDLKQSRLIALDRFRYYLNQFNDMTRVLQSLQNNRRITISSGEYLEDIIASLRYIMFYQADLLRQMIANNPALQSSLDSIYIQSRLENEKLSLSALQVQHKMLLESIAITDNKNPAERSSEKKPESTNLTFDSSVLAQFAEIYSRDANNILRRELAQRNVSLSERIAKQEMNVAYYDVFLKNLSEGAGKAVKNDSAAFDALLMDVVKNTIELSRKLAEFKDLLVTDYNSSALFYAPAGEAAWIKDHLIPMKKLVAGAVIIWLLLNVIYAGILFGNNYVWLKPKDA